MQETLKPGHRLKHKVAWMPKRFPLCQSDRKFLNVQMRGRFSFQAESFPQKRIRRHHCGDFEIFHLFEQNLRNEAFLSCNYAGVLHFLQDVAAGVPIPECDYWYNSYWAQSYNSIQHTPGPGEHAMLSHCLQVMTPFVRSAKAPKVA